MELNKRKIPGFIPVTSCLIKFHFQKLSANLRSFLPVPLPHIQTWGHFHTQAVPATEQNKEFLVHYLPSVTYCNSPSLNLLCLLKTVFISTFYCPGGNFPAYRVTQKILPFNLIHLPSFSYSNTMIRWRRLNILLIFSTTSLWLYVPLQAV